MPLYLIVFLGMAAAGVIYFYVLRKRSRALTPKSYTLLTLLVTLGVAVYSVLQGWDVAFGPGRVTFHSNHYGMNKEDPTPYLQNASALGQCYEGYQFIRNYYSDINEARKLNGDISDKYRETLTACTKPEFQQNADAMLVAALLVGGDSPIGNMTISRGYYEQSANLGNVHSLYRLAEYEDRGWGAPADKTSAEKHFKQAAEKGYKPAQDWLRYSSNRVVDTSQSDYAAKFAELLHKADQGDVFAQAFVASGYKGLNGIEPDYVKAVHYLQMAVDGGDCGSMLELANYYREGSAVPSDDVKANALYRRAMGVCTDSNNQEAAKFQLAGWEVTAESATPGMVREGMALLNELADQHKHIDAMLLLADFASQGKHMPQNDVLAEEWYRKAVKQENIQAKFLYARFLRSKKRLEEARQWYRDAQLIEKSDCSRLKQGEWEIFDCIDDFSQQVLMLNIAHKYADMKLIEEEARKGNASAQYALADTYRQRRTPSNDHRRDRSMALMLYALAIQNGYRRNDPQYDAFRNAVTKEEIADAEVLKEEWRKAHPKAFPQP